MAALNADDCLIPKSIDADPGTAGKGVIVSYILTAITCHIFIALAFGLSKLKQRYPKGIRHIELWRETLTNMAIASNLQQSYLGLALQVTAWARLGSKNDLSYYHFRIMAAIIILPLLTHTATVATFDRRLRKHTGPFLLNYISMGLNALAAISLLLINVIGWRYPPSALVGTSLHCGIDESIEMLPLVRASFVIVSHLAGIPCLWFILNQSQALGQPKVPIEGPNDEREINFGQMLPLILIGSNVVTVVSSYLDERALKRAQATSSQNTDDGHELQIW